MVSKGDNTNNLFNSFSSISSSLKELYDGFYYFNINGKKINIDWIETTFEVSCPSCNMATFLSNEYKKKPGYYKCINEFCKHHNDNGFAPKDAQRNSHKYLYLVGYDDNKNKVFHTPITEDLQRLEKDIKKKKNIVESRLINIDKDLIPINWDRQKEDILERKNIIYFQDFFTKRNLLILHIALDIIKAEKSKLSQGDYELIRIAFSNTLKETNIMSFTNNSWQGGKPTSWSRHAYWVPSQFCEVNVFNSFRKSIKRVEDSLNFNNIQDYEVIKASNYQDFKDGGNFYLNNNSVALGDIPENSVDSIITDPPYGSNVQYLELSHFWFPWNKDLYKAFPDFNIEAISNRKKDFDGAKSMYTYENNLLKVFKKCYKVLKPNKNLVLTFNNKDFSSWLALLFSIYRAGFTLEKNGIYFQEGIKNYRQTAHTRYSGSLYGDFIYVFKKDPKKIKSNIIEFTNEQIFSENLDSILNKNINKTMEDKNKWLIEFLFDSMPLIEGFSKSYLQNNTHSLYKKFDKNYLKGIY